MFTMSYSIGSIWINKSLNDKRYAVWNTSLTMCTATNPNIKGQSSLHSEARPILCILKPGPYVISKSLLNAVVHTMLVVYDWTL